ncbi:MAG: hypothetical protein RMM98_17950, partial [Acidobacteriota bacterium]|nr:hypothetical protein [Acidobacteriota bacterium]
MQDSTSLEKGEGSMARELPSVGDRVVIAPSDEPAEVFDVQQTGSQVRLGVIFLRSKKAERLVFSLEEFAQRVQ